MFFHRLKNPTTLSKQKLSNTDHLICHAVPGSRFIVVATETVFLNF
jgi:hypothetical protein